MDHYQWCLGPNYCTMSTMAFDTYNTHGPYWPYWRFYSTMAYSRNAHSPLVRFRVQQVHGANTPTCTSKFSTTSARCCAAATSAAGLRQCGHSGLNQQGHDWNPTIDLRLPCFETIGCSKASKRIKRMSCPRHVLYNEAPLLPR